MPRWAPQQCWTTVLLPKISSSFVSHNHYFCASSTFIDTCYISIFILSLLKHDFPPNIFCLLKTAVGLFNSEVKTHLLLFANRGSKDYTQLQARVKAVAPEFTGKVKITKAWIHIAYCIWSGQLWVSPTYQIKNDNNLSSHCKMSHSLCHELSFQVTVNT